MRSRRRALWSVPLALTVAGLALPMVGSGFIGWPFVAGWLVVLLLVWWMRPMGGAGRMARLAAGILTVGLLALLGTLGGFYLVPSVIAWLLLVATEPAQDRDAGRSSAGRPPPG